MMVRPITNVSDSKIDWNARSTTFLTAFGGLALFWVAVTLAIYSEL